MKRLIASAFLVVAADPVYSEPIASKVYTSVEQLGEIPFDDRYDENGDLTKEAKLFQKAWAGKKISVRGTLNQAGFVSIKEVFVTGCKEATKGLKALSVVTVSGKLKGRSVGGSGGMPIELTECILIK